MKYGFFAYGAFAGFDFDVTERKYCCRASSRVVIFVACFYIASYHL
jgi:hypothetical protein